MAKTKLEKLSFDEINKMNEKDLRDVTRKGIKASYNRLSQLKKNGYKESQYNKVFKDVIGKGEKSALKKLKKQSFSELKSTASYLKRHLESDQSSVAGMHRIEKDKIRLLNKLAGNENANIKMVKGGYKTGGSFIGREELSEFWEIVRKVNEDHSLELLKGGSGDGVNLVQDYVFNKKITSPSEILKMLHEKYREEQQERIRLEMEREEELEKIKQRNARFKNI